ncbi:hypothetical protein HYH03_008179 [Edaphochlamys debaryana]|uniref:Dolichol phosphate-mannose biosynthesis regulatory protein n=1 Tax=Edaphochlamys debaryana TaxID=47281 RepID=A0A835Y0S4_9CHLO|nr:hypothetical protein HYH03_008179 [Edaphochlamys debaryana]|eukprot:KAG2493665.1 hypothetical protein HYH03_008179 [Edaphochlamys debaryana]
MIADALCGRLIIIFGTLLFAYFSVWLLVLPFVEEDHPALRLFPPVGLALLAANTIGVGLAATALAVAGVALLSA